MSSIMVSLYRCKESACNVGDVGSIPGSGRSPGEGDGHPLRYSCLENSTDRGACGLQPMESQRVRHTTEQVTLDDNDDTDLRLTNLSCGFPKSGLAGA